MENVSDLQEENARLKAQLAEQTQRIHTLEELIKHIRQRTFGASSESHSASSTQILLPLLQTIPCRYKTSTSD